MSKRNHGMKPREGLDEPLAELLAERPPQELHTPKEDPPPAKPDCSPPCTHEDDPLLSLTDVGQMIGKSPQTVRRWCLEGLIAHVRLPSGRLEVRQSVIQRFLVGTALGHK